MKETVASLWKRSKFLFVVYAVLWLIVLLMPIHAFVSTWFGTMFGPLWLFKSWKEIVLGALAVAGSLWLLTHPVQRKEILSDKVVWLAGLYALILLAATCLNAGSLGLGAMWAGLAMNLRFPLIFVMAYIVARELKVDYGDVRHYVLHGLMWLGLGLALLGIAQVLLLDREFLTGFGYDKRETIAPYVLIDDNPDALRAFATLRGPNDYGAFLILPIIISLLLGILQKRRYLLLTAPMLIAIVFSSSRSAWLGLLLAVATLGVVVFGRHVLRKKKVVLAGVAGVLVGVGIVAASLTVPVLRLAIFHSSPGDPSLTEGSTDGHWSATWDGVERAVTAPLGGGAGVAGPASYYGDEPRISENYYVQIAEEAGIVGLGIFVAWVLVIFRRLYDLRPDSLAIVLLCAGIGISAIGFWLHVWNDDPLSLTYFMITGLVLGAAARRQAGKRA